MISPDVLQFPLDISLPPIQKLKAGELTLTYERGNLRSICFGKTEVLRMIYVAVRDHNWNTAEYEISDEKMEMAEEGFSVSYSATYSYGNEDVYQTEITIEGKSDNTIRFEMRGRALRDFRRNRIGICVHHPIRECAGKPVDVTRPDGSSYRLPFPELIAPHQPFLDIKKMEWLPLEETKAHLTFEGDIFESEDQRNWGDACYKTYSTPLSTPIPVVVKKGDLIEQSVTLQVKTTTSSTRPAPTMDGSTVTLPFPKIGLQASGRQNPLTSHQVGLLKKIPFDHYRAELRLGDKNWMDRMQRFVDEASQLQTSIDLVVFFDEGNAGETEALLSTLKPASGLLHSLLVLKQGEKVTPTPLIQSVYPLFKKMLPLLKIGYGTDAYFTELNRSRPGMDTPFDFISFSINPQVHASDTRSIMENVEALPWIVKTAKSFAQGREVFVSPITLKKRTNPDATAGLQTPDQQAEGVDQRQTSSFFATFTLLAIAGLAEADSVILSETIGWKGVMQGDHKPEQPHLFEATPGQLFPVYELLAKIRQFRPLIIRRPEILTWNEGVILENEQGEYLKLAVAAIE